MIYKLEGKDNEGEWVAVEFELVDGQVRITFETNEGSGILANLVDTEFSDLFSKIKPSHAPDTKQVWVKPMSKAIHEILEGNGLTVFGEYNMDELTFDSITLEILELFEAFIITGGVQIPEYKDGKKVR